MGINTEYRTGLNGGGEIRDRIWDKIQNGVGYRIRAVRERDWNQIKGFDTELSW